MILEVQMEGKYQRATAVICKQGIFPFPVNATAIAIVKQIVQDDQEELDLICAFEESPSQTVDQLVAASGFKADKVDGVASRLALKGLVFNQASSSGLMVYRVLPLMLIGVMEYKFMTDLTGSPGERMLAELFESLLGQLRDTVQRNYDEHSESFHKSPAVDRTVPLRKTEDGRDIKVIPVLQSVDVSEEFILPSQTVEDIIRKFDDIAVGHCFCRQRRRVMGHPCSDRSPTLNCFTFGKSARHTISQGFARKISQEEALKIMQDAEKAGLIHKAFHPGSRESKAETSICNCCKDCCDTLRLWRDGTLPLINSTYHLAQVEARACSGCGTCETWCPTEAIRIDVQGVAQTDVSACFGCGLCARFCPEKAIALKQGLRRVFILPPRLRFQIK